MKKILGILTIALATVFAAPTADARHYHRPSRTYVEFHRSCRGPAYIERYVAYYDSCGHPVFRTRVIPIRRHHHHRGHVEVRFSSGCR